MAIAAAKPRADAAARRTPAASHRHGRAARLRSDCVDRRRRAARRRARVDGEECRRRRTIAAGRRRALKAVREEPRSRAGWRRQAVKHDFSWRNASGRRSFRNRCAGTAGRRRTAGCIAADDPSECRWGDGELLQDRSRPTGLRRTRRRIRLRRTGITYHYRPTIGIWQDVRECCGDANAHGRLAPASRR